MFRDSSICLPTWPVVISAILSVLVGSCSTTDPGSGQQSGVSSLRAQADPPDLQADPPNAQGDPNPSSAGVESGKKLFATLGCAGCHTADGKGGLAGPDVSNEANKGRSREWLQTKIRNPKADNPQSIMPANPTLSDDQVNDLVSYLLSLATAGAKTGATAATTTQGRPTAATVSASSVAAGGATWSRRCGECHNLRPASEYSDAQWTVAMHHMRVRVPLTGEEHRNILKFLQATN